MPVHKQKPSDIAAEAKRRYIPYCAAEYQQYPPHSILIKEALSLRPESVDSSGSGGSRLRIAVIEGDPLDVAFEWYDYECSFRTSGCTHEESEVQPIPVINMANEKRPGGDWELGLNAPEENICRRSNLVQCLVTPWHDSSEQHYPIPQYGGIYSPHVTVFRSGQDKGYAVWPDFRSIPIISVSPSRRPKLDVSGDRYSFADEADHVRNKIRTILRIAAGHRHRNIVVGPWGLGSVYRNPPRELAQMWSQVLFGEDEFRDKFSNIVFAIDSHLHGPTERSTNRSDLNDYDIFKQELDPKNLHKEGYKLRNY